VQHEVQNASKVVNNLAKECLEAFKRFQQPKYAL